MGNISGIAAFCYLFLLGCNDINKTAPANRFTPKDNLEVKMVYNEIDLRNYDVHWRMDSLGELHDMQNHLIDLDDSSFTLIHNYSTSQNEHEPIPVLKVCIKIKTHTKKQLSFSDFSNTVDKLVRNATKTLSGQHRLILDVIIVE